MAKNPVAPASRGRENSRTLRGRVPVGIPWLAVGLLFPGCAEDAATNAPAPTPAPATSGGGLMLPPGFKPVDLPLEERQEIFREAHILRANAYTEANKKLPMDDRHLPLGDKPAFDKRVAEFNVIHEDILKKAREALAQRHKITVADLDNIEQEAGMLHWIPPEIPKSTPEPSPKSETK